MKKIIQGFWNNFKEIYKSFTVTNICLCLLSVVVSFLYNNFNDTLMKLALFLGTLSVFSFIVDASNNKKIYLYGCGAVVSAIITYVLYYLDLSDYMAIIVLKFVGGLYLLLLLLGVYMLYKKAKVSFSKFAISFIENTFVVSLIINIVMLGITFLLWITSTLLFSGIINYLLNVYIIIFGTVYVPLLIYSLINIKETHKITKTILCKVIYVICLIAYLIIYLYMIKIFIANEIPNNRLFIIVSLVYIFTLLCSIVVKDNSEGKIFNVINKYIHIVFIPLLGIQIYSLFVRMSEYGLTTVRYIGVLLIIFEIVSIIIRCLNKDDSILLLVLGTMVAFFLNVPYINVNDLPLLMQKKYLKQYKIDGKITEKVVGAYNYIYYYDYSEKIFDEIFSADELLKLDGLVIDYEFSHDSHYIDDDYYYDEKNNLSYSLLYDRIDVVNYNSVLYIDDSYNYTSDIFDVEETIKSYIEHEDEIDDYFMSNSVFYTIDSKFVVTSFDVYYYEDGEIDDYYISGYILNE